MKAVTREDTERFIHSLGFCKPLFFASGHDEFPVYCGGSCFVARYRQKYYVLTAKHCLRGDPERIYVLTNAQLAIPIRRSHFLIDDGDDSAWADVACLTTYPGEHMPPLDHTDFVDFDEHEKRHIFADIGHPLVLKAYPTRECEFTPASKLVRRPTIHMGFFGGQSESKHCHIFNVVYPKLGDPDGMSGAPVIKPDYEGGRGAFASVVGLVLQSSPEVEFVRFVGVDVLIRVLRGVQDEPF